MQKWQYSYLMVNTKQEVLEINGQKHLAESIFRSGEKVWDTLNRLGQEGWEVTGFSTLGPTGHARIIMKRPI